MLIGAGLRISEALRLTWRDVELDTSALHVSKTFKVGVLETPKGDRARTVVVAGYVLDVLEAHRPAGSDADDFIFKRDGGPVRRQ